LGDLAKLIYPWIVPNFNDPPLFNDFFDSHDSFLESDAIFYILILDEVPPKLLF
jgi:hypothetical protein